MLRTLGGRDAHDLTGTLHITVSGADAHLLRGFDARQIARKKRELRPERPVVRNDEHRRLPCRLTGIGVALGDDSADWRSDGIDLQALVAFDCGKPLARPHGIANRPGYFADRTGEARGNR